MEVKIKRDGLQLYGLLEGTSSLQNDKVVILMHGFKGDLGYDAHKINAVLAQALNKAGLPTWRFEFAGCGKSNESNY